MCIRNRAKKYGAEIPRNGVMQQNLTHGHNLNMIVNKGFHVKSIKKQILHNSQKNVRKITLMQRYIYKRSASGILW